MATLAVQVRTYLVRGVHSASLAPSAANPTALKLAPKHLHIHRHRPPIPKTPITHKTCYLLLWALTFTRLLPPNNAPARLSPLSFLAMGYAILLNLHWVSQARALVFVCVRMHVWMGIITYMCIDAYPRVCGL